MTTQRVFVLGSGFSAAMGLPTLADVFSNVMEYKSRRDNAEQDKQTMRDALKSLYPHFPDDARRPSYPAFEEFLSLVTGAKELAIEGCNWDQTEIGALRLMMDYLNESCKAVFDSPEMVELLRSFVARLRPGDSVITFNWDWLVEQQLFQASRKFSFVERGDRTVALLKLHGSIGWFYWEDGRPPIQEEYIVEFSEHMFHLRDHKYFDMWGWNKSPFIVPPVYSKRFEKPGLMKHIWQRAQHALAEADEIVIIGYSMPREDIHARALLRTGLWLRSQKLGSAARPYRLVDPNAVVAGTYFALVAENLDFLQMRFEDAASRALS